MIRGMLERLERFYGQLPSPPSDPFALYVWEVLSVHTTPGRRDAAMSAIRKIPALTPDAVAKAAPKKIEDAVALAGPHREDRLRALKAGVDAFRRDPALASAPRDPLPAAAASLERLPHLSASGGERLLLFAGNHAIVPFDAAHARVAIRLGLGHPDATDLARSALDAFGAALSSDLILIRRAVVYFAHHGMTTCTESDPHCKVCPLLPDCREGRARTH
jgi:endonuclease III